MIDSKVFQSTPVYSIHRKGYAFQKMIESTAKPLELNTISSVRSKDSNSSTSSEKSVAFLDSPLPKSQLQTYDQTTYKYPEPDQNYFKAYRKFLKKSVPVIRRRQFDLSITENLSELKQDSPKHLKKNLESKQFSMKKTRKKFTAPDIPLYLYENFRFQQICKEISERRAVDQRYLLEKKKKAKSLSKLSVFHESKPDKFPEIKKAFEHNCFFKVNQDSKVFSKQSSTKFLPARKRYLRSELFN